jgi:hypothetical protein
MIDDINPDTLSKEMLDRCAKAKEDAITEAMAAGVDLHEMEIIEWFSSEPPLIFYHCIVRRKKE